jgi:S-formylglutathione hydrolase FrmB
MTGHGTLTRPGRSRPRANRTAPHGRRVARATAPGAPTPASRSGLDLTGHGTPTYPGRSRPRRRRRAPQGRRVAGARSSSWRRGAWKLAVPLGLVVGLEMFTLPLHLGSDGSPGAPAAGLSAPILQQVLPRGQGYLEDPTLTVLLLVAGVLLFVVATGSGRARRRLGVAERGARARGVLASGAALFLIVTGVGAGINDYVGYVPDLTALLTLGESLDGTAVTTIPISFPGEPLQWRTLRYGPQLMHGSLGNPTLHVPSRWTYVFTPPGYSDPVNRDRHYPVLYLLHGYPGTSTDWLRAGGAGRTADVLYLHHKMPATIIVAPETNGGDVTQDSECLDPADPKRPQLATFLTRTVVDYVDANFRTIRTARGRAIGGMSSGAYCALNLGLQHHDEYGAIIAIMPFGDPGDSGRAALANRPDLVAANTPSRYIPRLRDLSQLSVFVSAGTAEPDIMATMLALAKDLTGRHAQVVVQKDPGGHDTWSQAQLDLPGALTAIGPHLASG